MKTTMGIAMAIAIICGTVFAVSASASPASAWSQWAARETPVYNTTYGEYKQIMSDLNANNASAVQGDFRIMSGDSVLWSSMADSPSATLNTEIINCARSLNSMSWDGYLYVSLTESGSSSASSYFAPFKADIAAATHWITAMTNTLTKLGKG
jgi:hypothetical protein